jgi:hypothetical protein
VLAGQSVNEVNPDNEVFKIPFDMYIMAANMTLSDLEIKGKDSCNIHYLDTRECIHKTFVTPC